MAPAKDQIVEFSPKIRPAVCKNDRITIRANAIQVQNAGNVVIRLDDEYTLYPGGTVSIGSHTDLNIIVHEMHINFIEDPLGNWTDPDGVGAVMRCEIIENHIHNRVAAHYTETKGRR